MSAFKCPKCEKKQVETKSFALSVVSHSTLHARNVAKYGGLCSITNFAQFAGIT